MSFYMGNIVDDDITVVRTFFVSQSGVCGLQSAVCGLQSANVIHRTRVSPQLIATEVKSSWYFVRNVLRDYDMNNSSMLSTQKSIKNYKN